jgi:single-stranded DNA-binding protein
MNNGFPITVKGRIRKTIEVRRTADGRSYSRFDVAPPDALNKDPALSCIAFNTRAELLERFASRGDLVEISGLLGQTEYIEENGDHVSANNIIEATAITFPEENAGDGCKTEVSA